MAGKRVAVDHVTIGVSDLARSRAFYERVLAPLGLGTAETGPRPEYSPRYYGAFVLDPDGHNIEAVTRV